MLFGGVNILVNDYLNRPSDERLDAYSEKSMIPKTKIVEKATEEYLNKVAPEIAKPTKK